MPNSVWNRLVVEGSKAEVNRFADFVVSKELDSSGEPYVIDFEAHVPIPPDVPRTEKEPGERDIHTWVFDAWGSKQPMAPQILERSPGRIIYFLTTPVTVPIPWLETMAAMEPALMFEHEYVFEFDDIGHRKRYEAGELVSDDDVELTDPDWVTLDEE